jgi:hypothetical protein
MFRKICSHSCKFNTRSANRICDNYLVSQIIHDFNYLSVFDNIKKTIYQYEKNNL